jgi:hypothetical protein
MKEDKATCLSSLSPWRGHTTEHYRCGAQDTLAVSSEVALACY